jgi:hypothetical protein
MWKREYLKMSSQLIDQVNVWWKTVTDKESLGTFQKTIQFIWNILWETGRLLWLVLCLGLVLATWIWTSSKTSSQKLQAWYESIPEPKSERVWSEASQFLVSAGRTTATNMMSQAREQLGLPEPEATPINPLAAAPAPKPAAPAAAAPPAPETVVTAEKET